MRALVVDDVEINLMITKHFLERNGIKTDITSFTDDAVALASEREYDFILMDFCMPSENGDVVARKIRRIKDARSASGYYTSLPIYCCSATINNADGMSVFTGFVKKPVTTQRLNEILAEIADSGNILLAR